MFKVGIVGCGGIANGKHMPSLKKLKNVEMVAFCDIVKEKAEKAAKDFGVEGARVYESYKEMIEKENLDTVHVCTPNFNHCEITVAALEAGFHVMCEKPMAINYEQAKKMYDTHIKTGKKLTIGYQNRFRPDSSYLKEACVMDELGDIYFGRAIALRRRGVPTWGVFIDEEKQGGGPLIDIGTHALDLTLWFMNNYKVKSVKGSVFKKLKDQKNTANAGGDWDPEKYTVEDSAFGFITMENGATIILESSWALNIADPIEAATQLAGTKAGADMYKGLRINTVKHNKQVIEQVGGESGIAFYDTSGKGAADLEQEAFYNAIENDTDPVVLPEQALVVTRVLEAIYESAKTGKEVIFND